MDVTAESRQSLWSLTFGPAIWMAHFLLCYATASIWCAKVAGAGGALGTLPGWIAGYTIAALIAIVLVGRDGWRRHTHGGGGETPHDQDTAEDRHRFLGFATFLLAGLSAVATLYVGAAAAFFDTCR